VALAGQEGGATSGTPLSAVFDRDGSTNRRPSCQQRRFAPISAPKGAASAGEILGESIMKNAVIVGASLALLAMAQAAHAAPPKVSGKYVLITLTQCEARFTTTGTPVTSV
jgi:hypothetical protein